MIMWVDIAYFKPSFLHIHIITYIKLWHILVLKIVQEEQDRSQQLCTIINHRMLMEQICGSY